MSSASLQTDAKLKRTEAVSYYISTLRTQTSMTAALRICIINLSTQSSWNDGPTDRRTDGPADDREMMSKAINQKEFFFISAFDFVFRSSQERIFDVTNVHMQYIHMQNFFLPPLRIEDQSQSKIGKLVMSGESPADTHAYKAITRLSLPYHWCYFISRRQGDFPDSSIVWMK